MSAGFCLYSMNVKETVDLFIATAENHKGITSAQVIESLELNTSGNNIYPCFVIDRDLIEVTTDKRFDRYTIPMWLLDMKDDTNAGLESDDQENQTNLLDKTQQIFREVLDLTEGSNSRTISIVDFEFTRAEEISPDQVIGWRCDVQVVTPKSCDAATTSQVVISTPDDSYSKTLQCGSIFELPYNFDTGGSAPSNSSAPVISGTQTIGSTLSCTTGTWTGSPTFTYQWYLDGSIIIGATSNQYTLVSGQQGHYISCRVTATNAGGSVYAVSNSLQVGGFRSYNWPFLTQTTSYRNGDEGWQYTNVWQAVYDQENTQTDAGALYKKPFLVDFYTLAENNSFGNTARFTTEAGVAWSGNMEDGDIIVDNYLGIKILYTLDYSDDVWNTYIDTAVVHGDGSWLPIPLSLTMKLIDWQNASTGATENLNNYIRGTTSSNRIHTATTQKMVSTANSFALDAQNGFQVRNMSKTSTSGQICLFYKQGF